MLVTEREENGWGVCWNSKPVLPTSDSHWWAQLTLGSGHQVHCHKHWPGDTWTLVKPGISDRNQLHS